MKNENKEIWNKCNCGLNILRNENLIDTVYPCNRERTVFNAYCNVSMGGCGRIVYSDSLDMLLKRWNAGVTDDTDEANTFCCGQGIIDAIAKYNELKDRNNDFDIYLSLPLQANIDSEKPECSHKK